MLNAGSTHPIIGGQHPLRGETFQDKTRGLYRTQLYRSANRVMDRPDVKGVKFTELLLKLRERMQLCTGYRYLSFVSDVDLSCCRESETQSTEHNSL